MRYIKTTNNRTDENEGKGNLLMFAFDINKNMIAHEYDITLDSKKRVTVRGDVEYSNYHVKKLKNGVIVMEPRELKIPDDISENTLKMIYSSVKNFNNNKSKPIDFDKLRHLVEEEVEGDE